MNCHKLTQNACGFSLLCLFSHKKAKYQQTNKFIAHHQVPRPISHYSSMPTTGEELSTYLSLFNGVELDLARHDALDKVQARCLKTRLDIAGVVLPVYPHDLSEISLTVMGADDLTVEQAKKSVPMSNTPGYFC